MLQPISSLLLYFAVGVILRFSFLFNFFYCPNIIASGFRLEKQKASFSLNIVNQLFFVTAIRCVFLKDSEHFKTLFSQVL